MANTTLSHLHKHNIRKRVLRQLAHTKDGKKRMYCSYQAVSLNTSIPNCSTRCPSHPSGISIPHPGEATDFLTCYSLFTHDIGGPEVLLEDISPALKDIKAAGWTLGRSEGTTRRTSHVGAAVGEE